MAAPIHVATRLPEHVAAALDAYAERRGEARSVVVRRAIEREIGR